MKKIAQLGLIRPLWAAFAMLAVILVLGTVPALAAADAPAETVTAKDPEANAILMKMA